MLYTNICEFRFFCGFYIVYQGFECNNNQTDDDEDIICENILPPDRVDEFSDKEIINYDKIALNVDPKPLNDITGFVKAERK